MNTSSGTPPSSISLCSRCRECGKQRRSSGSCNVEQQNQRRRFGLSAPSISCGAAAAAVTGPVHCTLVRPPPAASSALHSSHACWAVPKQVQQVRKCTPVSSPSTAQHDSWIPTHLRASIEAGLGACRHQGVVRDCVGRHALPPHATPHLQRPAGGRWLTGRGQIRPGMGASNWTGTELLGDAPEAASQGKRPTSSRRGCAHRSTWPARSQAEMRAL